jgi:hypothetical protein
VMLRCYFVVNVYCFKYWIFIARVFFLILVLYLLYIGSTFQLCPFVICIVPFMFPCVLC